MTILPMAEAAERESLRVTYQREISYAIMHPARPVLHMEELALAELVGDRPALIVADKHVWQCFGKAITAYAKRHLRCLAKITVEGSERRKDWTQVRKICSQALHCGLPRDGVIVAFGGGVTLDLAGMAASLYRRGVTYVRVPTTLVGIVDTAVGIKQGFNFRARKNMLGTFYPPAGVINDLTFLRTLSVSELSCGVAEILKMGIVSDAALVALLEEHGETLIRNKFQSPHALALEVLLRAEQVMIEELQPNLFETRHARLADFGHTFSPRLERASEYELRHGEAVALDMILSTAIAVQRKLCSESLFTRLVLLYRSTGLPWSSPYLQPELLVDSLDETRLHRSGDLNLVVPLDFGKADFLQDVTKDDLDNALAMLEDIGEALLYRRASSGV
jgi:2-epi-5-epi-valiolone synthase